jgi:hypothetical protein
VTSEAWEYVGSADPERIDALHRSPPLSQLPTELLRGMSLRCFHWEKRDGDPNFERAVFCGEVSRSLFDWFFNSRTGYRGAFFQSPEAGSRENRLLLDRIAPDLAKQAVTQGLSQDEARILASLRMNSAKLWLAEYPGLCPSCAGEWSKSYISGHHAPDYMENARKAME